MIYQPKSDKKGAVTAAALFALSVLVAAVAPITPNASGAINVVALILLGASLFITTRYAMSAYTYQISEESLVITRTIGTRSTILASLSLKTGEGVVKKPRSKEERLRYAERFGTADASMSFCRNIFASPYIYVTEFNGKKYEILLEIDEEFAAALDDAVKRARLFGGN